MLQDYRYFALHKPYGMVSQFVSPDPVRLLGELDFSFPEGTHALGRLDADSEGLLLLTTDRRMTRWLFSSGQPHHRTYLVRVKGRVEEASLEKLRQGIVLPHKGGGSYTTSPCAARQVETPGWLDPRPGLYEPAPHTWLEMVLTEGRYHQVRKMVCAIGHRCQRLVRVSMEDLHLDSLPPGGVQEYAQADFFRLLHLSGAG